MRITTWVTLLTSALQSNLASATPASDPDIVDAWLAFADARGNPSLILGDVDHPSVNDVFRVIPDVSAEDLDSEKLQLGFDLFQERRLSRDGTVACTSCHIGMIGGVDRRPVSLGIGGARGTLNAPTIFNAALNFRQFWDGRALNLQEQALGPIANPIEFGHDLEGVVAVLKQIPAYVNAFDSLYVNGVTAANLGDAIAYYETMNFTGLDSPFLRQFEDHQALEEKARHGQKRFVEVGCASCHNGVNLGGNSFQQLGVAAPWYGIGQPATRADDGLFGRTAREQDQHVFKVPTLHHVAATGPWLHDGSITSLHQAVDRMALYQSGRYLDNEDIDSIVAFLRSLGDSLGMIGDCSVSGSYSIIMDCSVNPIVKTGSDNRKTEAMSARDVLADQSLLAQQHLQQYNDAMSRTIAAPERIAEEIRRIRSGQVAHFDFLQYEHIEMLRHARALSFPPATMESAQRDAMLVKASEWQQRAERYEFIIGDFLRAQAIASGARSNFQDLVRILSAGADEKVLSLLAQADRSAEEFYTNPMPDNQAVLGNSTRALVELDLNPERLEELQLQAKLLLENNEVRFFTP